MSINRYELVSRHNPQNTKVDAYSPLSVGNGELAFSADITGLQSFPEGYEKAMPLCTQSQWGWHSTPMPEELKGKEYEFKMYDTFGRNVPYASNKLDPLYDWLRENPHRLHLGKIGLAIFKEDGSRAKLEDIANISQTLDMWEGVIKSNFTVEGIPVSVKTVCHPTKDILAVAIESELFSKGRLFVEYEFPYGSPRITAADYASVDKHSTEIIEFSETKLDLLRILDEDRYFVNNSYSHKVTISKKGPHTFFINPEDSSNKLSFTTYFAQALIREELPDFEEVCTQSTAYWKKYWSEGGAVQLANSKNERAMELERRIVLSQYLTAIQCSGSIPPQETGLTCNSWYGKPHLEMHFWHAAHFPLWGKGSLLARSMWWYKSIMDKADEIAKMQGYEGVRWPKMVDDKGNNSPSPIAPLLIWQQPHPIYFAEILYRERPTREVLETYKDIVFKSAEFMASFAHYVKEEDRYVLGAPLIPAQENHKAVETLNPTYELEYWVFGLEVAMNWLKRLGLPENEKWAEVVNKISKLPIEDGVYLAHEKCPKTFTEFNVDHPSMLAALGVLPGKLVENKIMKATLDRVFKDWTWVRTWGWDYPVVAMTAARLGEPELAIDALLMDAPKNLYLNNGHNRQVTRDDLPLYLPGNGGLLLAVGMMAAGWDNGPETHAPGFPSDWVVEYEGISKMP